MSSIGRVIGRQEKVTSRGSLSVVIPAKAGIQSLLRHVRTALNHGLGSRFRGNDDSIYPPLTLTVQRVGAKPSRLLLPQLRHLYRTSFLGREVGGENYTMAFKGRVEARQWHRFFLGDAVDESLELRLIGMVFHIA